MSIYSFQQEILWILVSIQKYFRDNIGNLKFYVDDCPDWTTIENRVELRVSGPHFRQLDSIETEVTVDIDTLVSTPKSATDKFKPIKNVGIVAAAFTTRIPIYRYGNPSDDEANDSSLFGCLELQHHPAGPEQTRIENFGSIDPGVKLIQSTIDARYKMRFGG